MSESPLGADTVGTLDLFRLDSRVVIVTGASSGFGSRFAKVLDDAGAQVILASRRVHEMAGIAEGLRNADVVRCDVTSGQEVDALVTSVVDRHGRVDVLVNNAGAFATARAEAESDEQIRHVLEVDLIATMMVTRRVGQEMLASGRPGSIINIASVAGLIGFSGRTRLPAAAYVAAKGGVVSVTRELAAQWGPKGIRVNAIAPGVMDAGMGAGIGRQERAAVVRERQTPLRRFGQIGDLDGLLLLLASDASSFITGQTIAVDGGWSVT